MSGPAAPVGGPPDADHPDRHALLVVRAWPAAAGGLAARVWTTPDVGTVAPTVRLVDSADEVVDAVQEWLARIGPPAS